MDLHNFSKTIASTLSMDEVEGSILERITRLMGTPSEAFLLLDEEKTLLICIKYFGFN
jgi:hypothetical protein